MVFANITHSVWIHENNYSTGIYINDTALQLISASVKLAGGRYYSMNAIVVVVRTPRSPSPGESSKYGDLLVKKQTTLG